MSPKPNTNSAKVIDYLKTRGEEGASRSEIAAGTGMRSKSVSMTLDICVARHGVIAAGPEKYFRFFLEKPHADEYWQRIPAILAKVKADAHQRMLARQRASYARNKPPPKPRPKKEAKPKPAPKPRVKLKLGNEAPVKMATSRATLMAAPVLIPPHIKVQRGPAWTHDVRFQVEPGSRVIGEFTAEWRQRRSA